MLLFMLSEYFYSITQAFTSSSNMASSGVQENVYLVYLYNN